MEWLSEPTELLATVCENVIILWFLTSFFGTKYDGYKKIIAFIAAVVITTVFTSLFSFAFPNEFLACTFGFIIILAVYCRLCLKGTVWCHILLPVMSETVLMLVAVSINQMGLHMMRVLDLKQAFVLQKTYHSIFLILIFIKTK